MNEPKIAVLIPCYNEAASIATVVEGFRKHLPTAEIYVYDNNSSDSTAEIARTCGAIVRSENQQGKGHVVRRMFSDIDAAIYVLVDGDDTYDPASAPALVQALLDHHCDMVNAVRETDGNFAYRFGHKSGNRLLTGIAAFIFGNRSIDMLSGYRVFSHRFVKSFPALSTGFEIETELTIHALALNLPIIELATPYRERSEESESKLNTYRDGLRIVWKVILLMKEERPFLSFSIVFLLLSCTIPCPGDPCGSRVAGNWFGPQISNGDSQCQPHVTGFFKCDDRPDFRLGVSGKREMKRLSYLNIPWLGAHSTSETRRSARESF